MINGNVLVTGCAGFIGFFLSKSLLEKGVNVYGLDNLNSYYDVGLKKDRLKELNVFGGFTFLEVDISNKESLVDLTNDIEFDIVIHLAAQAGVRYSVENPKAYIDSNIVGFHNIIEVARNRSSSHFVYASSSSVYGSSKKTPFEESDRVDSPTSLYAATKKSNELIAYAYSSVYGLKTTGLRFFTVYGPFGRPDMAYSKFVESFFKDVSIEIYDEPGFKNNLYRDFTYIDDIVSGINEVIASPNEYAINEVLNIGRGEPVFLSEFILTLERCLSNSLGSKVEFMKEFVGLQSGDVKGTYSSCEKLSNLTGYRPKTSLEVGLQEFTDWYVDYYGKREEIK